MFGSSPRSPEEDPLEGPSPYSMTEEELVRKSKIVNRGRFCTQFYCALTASLGTMCFGIVLGWPSPEIRRFIEGGKTNDASSVKMATMLSVGCSIGSIFFNIVCHRNGPRKVLLTITPIQAIVWIIVASSGVDLPTHYIMTISGTVSIGFMICGETLLRDSVHVGHIYRFLVMLHSSQRLGILLAYMFGSMSHDSYYCLAFSAAMTLLLMPMLWFLPESPVFLYKKNPIKSEKALECLRGRHNIYDDMRSIRKNHELRVIDISARYMLFKPVVFKAVIIIAGLTFFKEFTGYMAIVFFGSNIIHNFGHDFDTFGNTADGVVLGSSLFICNVVSRCVHSKFHFPVRKSLLTSATAVTTILLLHTAYFYLMKIDKETNMLRLFLSVGLVISYECGWSFYPDEIMFDYLPFQVYPLVKALMSCLRWLSVFIMLTTVSLTQTSLETIYTSYAILSAISFVGIVFISVFVIETKGRTLMAIQIKLGGNPVGSQSAVKRRFNVMSTQY